MRKIPFSIFDLTEDQAISLLEADPEQLEEPEDRYIAASQLAKHPSERTINTLIATIQAPSLDLHTRIVRRKAVESLGYLQAFVALPTLHDCLQDEDCYTVDNAVWSIGEIGTQDVAILTDIVLLLDRPRQNHRLIIQTLAKLGYQPATEEIRSFIDAEDEATASAAISAMYQLTGDGSHMEKIIELLQHSSVNVRRSCIQDLIDAEQYSALPKIARSPVSIAFRLRGVRLLAERGILSQKMTFQQIEPVLNRVLLDHPNDLEFVHEYDQTPSLEFAINELYQTDNGRCYLATQTLLESYPETAPDALIHEYHHKAHGDYGAHYHVIKVLGWFQYAPAYNIFIEALSNPQPQFQKSRAAAAISLGRLGNPNAIPVLRSFTSNKIWTLSYACLMALEQMGESLNGVIKPDSADLFVREKYLHLVSGQTL